MSVRILGTVIAFTLAAASARAEIKTKVVDYQYDGKPLQGFLAWDAAKTGKRPGVLVFHEWWGVNEYSKKRAEQLAGMGYVAFVADMYGKGIKADQPKDAAKLATAVRGDIKAWQGRALAGLKILQDNELVDGKKLAAIGYCFGGSTALQLAYSGAPLAAAVSFHGALPIPEDAKTIKAKVLICHGAADAFIPEETIQKVRAKLEAAGVDYQMVYYGNAVHSFTVPGADARGLKGIAYQAEADHRSWTHMKQLFDEAFSGK